jgi:hypothetical protein
MCNTRKNRIGQARKPRGWEKISLPILIVSLFLAVIPLRGQQGPAISVDAKMVSMLVTVRDKHAHLVNNFTKDDFVLEQDGHPQTITYFTRDSAFWWTPA